MSLPTQLPETWESQNSREVWVGRDLKAHPIPSLPWAGNLPEPSRMGQPESHGSSLHPGRVLQEDAPCVQGVEGMLRDFLPSWIIHLSFRKVRLAKYQTPNT